MSAPKGQHYIAQGNALGKAERRCRPERAKVFNDNRQRQTILAALSGRASWVAITQGVIRYAHLPWAMDNDWAFSPPQWIAVSHDEKNKK